MQLIIGRGINSINMFGLNKYKSNIDLLLYACHPYSDIYT